MPRRVCVLPVSAPLGHLFSQCTGLESEPGKKRKAETLASFLKELGPDEIKPAIMILLAQVLPKSEKGGLDVVTEW